MVVGVLVGIETVFAGVLLVFGVETVFVGVLVGIETVFAGVLLVFGIKSMSFEQFNRTAGTTVGWRWLA